MDLFFETERLLMRPFQESDGPFLYELNTLEVLKYTGDVPFESIEAAGKFALDYVNDPNGQFLKHNMGRLAVLNKEDNAFLGWAGLKRNSKNNVVDVGYRFMEKHWGKGYATESTRRLLQLAFKEYNLDIVTAHVHELNIGSQRVVEKLGMYIDHRFLWEGIQPARFYQITKDEYRNT